MYSENLSIDDALKSINVIVDTEYITYTNSFNYMRSWMDTQDDKMMYTIESSELKFCVRPATNKRM